MSISLKAVNDRLSKIRITKLHSGYRFPNTVSSGFTTNITLSESWRNFQVLLFSAGTQSGDNYASPWFPLRNCCMMLTDAFDIDKNWMWSLTSSIDVNTHRGEAILVQAVNNTTLKYIIHSSKDTSGDGVYSVYGLKLYYSFSYNIIYRATHLLEKIFMS